MPVEEPPPPATAEEMEREILQLREAVASRQLNGVAIGLVAGRFECSPEQAWSFLVRMSRDSNTKVRDIARVVVDGHCGRLSEEDESLAASLEAFLPRGQRLVNPHAPLDGHGP